MKVIYKNICLLLAMSASTPLFARVVSEKTSKNKEEKTVLKDFGFQLGDVVKSMKVPIFSSTSNMVFDRIYSTNRDGRLQNILNALKQHGKEKPKGWEQLVALVRNEPTELGRLRIANGVINKVPYMNGTDGSYYHPAKLFTVGGVCKDFVVAKYLLLKEAGYSLDSMRIALLTPKEGKEADPFHVVLVAKADGKDYVLDLIPGSSVNDTPKQRLNKLKEIRMVGLDTVDAQSLSDMNPAGFYQLEKYKAVRGLVWAGNENGRREFIH